MRWRVKSGSTGNPVALRVLRPVSGTTYTGAGTSSTQTTTGAIDEFNSQVPIKAGDSVGLNIGTTGLVWATTPGASAVLWGSVNGFTGGLPDGATGAGDAQTPVELLLQAVVEPDCDGDGLGDETQDADLSPCIPDTTAPDTTITKGPKDKTKKKTATFEFSSNEAGSSFECSLDGAAFAPCTSPHAVTVKKGKHSFQVRARDGAGNVDATPATDDWKVKKKKKKK